MSVEFRVFLQCLLSITTLSLPDQTALSIHGTHCVEFQFKEYVPALHGLHVELSIMTSPGFQYLNDTVMVSLVGRSKYDTFSESIRSQLAIYSTFVAPG